MGRAGFPRTKSHSKRFTPPAGPGAVTGHFPPPEQGVIGDCKPVCLITDLLDVPQSHPFWIELPREHLTSHIYLLFFFGNSDHRDDKVKTLYHLKRSGQLAFPAIDDDQVGEIRVLLDEPVITPFHDLCN